MSTHTMPASNESVLLFVLLLIQILCVTIRIYPTVDTPTGKIQGLIDDDYAMFLGIPYAKVDDDNPFGPSKPLPKFKNIFQADDDLAICPQLNIYNNRIQGTLDCLRLNIYVPNSANVHNKLPVMVFIPGGSFKRCTAGRYQYGPKYLVRHNVLLVILNHRVGPYGFLCLDIPEVSGNQGLKDQVNALKWINNNIESFGGDPDQVTIFGFSSGAVSADLHLMYTDEKLFKQVIIQSGSSQQEIGSTPDNNALFKLTKYFGISTNSTTEALFFLATVDPILLIETVNKLKMNFGLCFENKFDGVEAFITETFINVKKSNVKGKNIMLGIDEYEGAHFIKLDEYRSNNIINKLLSGAFDVNIRTLREMNEFVHRFYLGDEKISECSQLALIDFLTDFKVVHPMERSLKKYLKGEPNNIYYYMFSYNGERNNGHIKFNVTFDGAIHGDEIGYLFDPEFLTRKPTPDDQLMLDRMTTLWTNFAKYGNPTPQKTKLLPVKWTPFSGDHSNYLRIDTNFTMENSLFHKRLAFWDLFYKLNEDYQKGYVKIDQLL